MSDTPKLEEAADSGLRLTTCSRSWLVCDGCGKLWEDTTENLGEMCECGRICIRMEWATEKDRLAAIHQKATSALQTSWLYSGKEHVEKLMREIAAISSENEKCPSVDDKEKAK